ncbi:unnamed protein product [Prorocentrum cordatum]|uniref:Uncharacterized protein n=1 Tax=Prorocentrum cordatum TaxID=2364126 RepID=A0ABN9UXN1_9DINO|nr:unnamed protein product [Polarella glacialis]
MPPTKAPVCGGQTGRSTRRPPLASCQAPGEQTERRGLPGSLLNGNQGVRPCSGWVAAQQLTRAAVALAAWMPCLQLLAWRACRPALTVGRAGQALANRVEAPCSDGDGQTMGRVLYSGWRAAAPASGGQLGALARTGGALRSRSRQRPA